MKQSKCKHEGIKGVQLELPLFEGLDEPISPPKSCRSGDFSLPAAGNRNGASINNVGSEGNYWSSTANSSTNARNVNFNGTNFNSQNNNNRYNGFAVRLAREINAEPSALERFLYKLHNRPHYTLNSRLLMTDLIAAYHDARKHKRGTVNQLRFEMNQERQLVQLRDRLLNRTYKPGRSTAFIVNRPHQREVFAAAFYDRVVHHLMFNYVNPMLEHLLSPDCYSCRKGKGTLYGINRLEHHIRSVSENYTQPCYVLKMDFTGYFMNIRRSTLLARLVEMLERQAFRPVSKTDRRTWAEVVDIEFVLYLGEIIISYDPTTNCLKKGTQAEWNSIPPGKSLYTTPAGCGLPIGNLTSQMFSNLYVMPLLQYIQRGLRLRHSGHYVDDAYAVSQSYEELQKALPLIEEYAKQHLEVRLNKKKTKIVDAYRGMAFLGAYLLPYRRYIERDSLKRMKRHLLTEGAILDEATRKSTEGTLVHYNAYRLSCKLFREEGIYEQVFGSGIAAC